MKYKLIKWYPALPLSYKVGDIIAFTKGKHICSNGYEILEYHTGASEFWEKVVKKDYKVLSIKWENTEQTIKFRENYRYKYYNWGSNWKINSVRRLSDGEIFTVGDKVQHWIESRDGHLKWEVNSIKLFDNVIYLYSGTGFKMKLEAIGKQKQSLFITHDGVDIYEGDDCYAILKNTFTLLSLNPLKYEGNDGTLLYFSTKQKAEEFILKKHFCYKASKEAYKLHIEIGGYKNRTTKIKL